MGDTKGEVLEKCGEPDYIEFREKVYIIRDFYRPLIKYPEYERYQKPLFVEEYITVEEWIYNLGPRRFIRYLVFENGRLTRIITGHYGY